MITGLRGLLFTSATGAKSMWMPSARASSPMIRAACSASAGSSVAPNAIACGNCVPPPIRMPTPNSKSAAFRSGSFDRRCRRFNVAAASSGWPRITVPYVGFSRYGRRRLGAAKDDEAADMAGGDEVRQARVLVAVGGQVGRLERRHDELADLLVERERGQRLLDPAGGVPLGRCRGHGDTEKGSHRGTESTEGSIFLPQRHREHRGTSKDDSHHAATLASIQNNTTWTSAPASRLSTSAAISKNPSARARLVISPELLKTGTATWPSRRTG